MIQPLIEPTVQILLHGETCNHSDDGGDGHRHQHTDKAKERAKDRANAKKECAEIRALIAALAKTR